MSTHGDGKQTYGARAVAEVHLIKMVEGRKMTPEGGGQDGGILPAGEAD